MNPEQRFPTDMKIAFFGTSDRSTPILESLKEHFEVVLCVTKEDVLVGRHRTPKEVEVKKWAKDNGVTYVTIKSSLKAEIDPIVEQIKSSKAEMGVVADFGYIIPQQILDIFPAGLINIHFSLLPKYRGASPVQHAILTMDKETGITYQLMQFDLDAGPILKQIPYPLTGTETSGELYQTLFKIAAKNLPQVISGYINGEISPQPQDQARATYTYSPSHPKTTYIYKEDAKIDWNQPMRQIYAAIRAYNPWPIAWTTLKEMQSADSKIQGFTKVKDVKQLDKKVKIYYAEITQNGLLAIQNLQLEGGKTLSWREFFNGYLQ